MLEQEGGASDREALVSMRVTLQPIDERTRLPTQAANRIVDLAKSGNTEPIKQLACSIGLPPDDTGDYYTCDQMHYAAADGSDAGLSYWLLHLEEVSVEILLHGLSSFSSCCEKEVVVAAI